ncbi:asparagine synthase-related protein [Psychrobacillus sp. NPDC096426]|uniref:asparagine synthase-related protein n=1 Tax=Psychrobacillus sp. NPDC096426 TaxID=3364491 RepID=UPI0038128F20
MSAIACIYHRNQEPVAVENINRIMGSLQQYPADDIQVWHKENVFLGCHAQWITPESIGEKLPYYDRVRQLTITTDAIIDNRKELFNLLQIESIVRKEIPDSQLILLAYCKWGQEAPKYLIGDYAFIIWDEKEQLLFGARDFSGSRTLYFTQLIDKFAFCTTIKPLLTLPFIKKQLNEQWLAEYLAIPGMTETVEPFITPYDNIYQVPPAHSISIKEGKFFLRQHTVVQVKDVLKLKTDEEYVEAFQEVFQEAVTARIRTNHQVGAYLSGGLDSGSIASFAAKALKQENKTLHTYSYIPVQGFKDWTPKRRVADERDLIESTVEYVGNISPNFLDFKGKSPLSDIDEMLEIYEMPYKFFINSYWSKGCYEEASNDGVGIILNGARGNWSISWGPPLDYQALLLKKLKIFSYFREVNQYSKNIGVPKSRITSITKRKAFTILDRNKNMEMDPTFQPINVHFAKKMNVHEKVKQHGMEHKVSFNAYEARKENFEKLAYWNINGTMATKLSLRYKTWNRDPSNDLRIIRFCLSVPEEQYVQNGMDRSLIRRSTKGFLPDSIRLNQRVRGIQGTDGIDRMTPFWSDFVSEIKHLTNDPIITSYIDVENIKKALSDVQTVPTSSFIYDARFKMMMRCLCVYRFLKSNFEGG